MPQFIVSGPPMSCSARLPCRVVESCSAHTACALVCSEYGLDASETVVRVNGCLQAGSDRSEDPQDVTSSAFSTITISLRLYGGKGGFGSMLRSAGAKFSRNKDDNVDACRDLSGRRVRQVNAEKQVADFIRHKEKERQEAELQKRQMREKILSGPRHQFDHRSAMRDLEEIEEKNADALREGIMKKQQQQQQQQQQGGGAGGGGGTKRSGEDASGVGSIKVKRRKMWEEEEEEDDGSESDEEMCGKEEKEARRVDERERERGEKEAEKCVTETETTETQIETKSETKSEGQIETKTERQIETKSEGTKEKREEEEKVKKVEGKTIDLEQFASVESLLSVSLEDLKHSLQEKGLKCGGTVKERAERLFRTKGLTDLSSLPSNMFAKKK